MAENEYTIPACVQQAIKDEGYSIDGTMASKITEWWSWFTSDNKFYDGFEHVDDKVIHRHRMSLHPARRVCREWVSVILDDTGTTVTADDPTADEILHHWMDKTQFITIAQRAIERGFGLGTGAVALWFDVDDEETHIKPRRYDSRMIVPLSWDDDSVPECAFCTRSTVRGKKVDYLQMHVLREPEGGGKPTYHILTKIFHEGQEMTCPEFFPDFDTGTHKPTFWIIRPNIDNVYADMSAYGQSVFADAIDCIKTVDECFDSFSRELKDTKIKTFMSDELFSLDAKGNPKPMSWDASVVSMVTGHDVGSMIQNFAPPMRVDQLTKALDMALSQLGDQTGFGPQYFRYDIAGGIKTATEVSSDNAAFARNIVKHENILRPGMEALLMCVLECMRIHNGETIPDDCPVEVNFDDSIIEDTTAEKNMAMAEMACMPDISALKVNYLTKYKGFTEEEAQALVPQAVVVDEGF